MLTQQYLKSRLHYNTKTGVFTWISKVHKSPVKIGEVAGCLKDGYIYIGLMGKKYLAHRLAFLYVEGQIPEFIDHIDRNRRNNKWSNLRPANFSKNAANTGVKTNNTTGYKGIVKMKIKTKNPWQAGIKINGKKKHLGYFKTAKEAAIAYDKAAIEIFGRFACLNFKEKL